MLFIARDHTSLPLHNPQTDLPPTLDPTSCTVYKPAHAYSSWGKIVNHRLGLLRSLLIYYGNPLRRRQLRSFYAGFIRPGDLCFDLGAHVGNRTGLWAALGARVIALEPQPNLMAYMQRKYGHTPNITLLQEAVGAAAGTAVLHISPRNPTVATLSQQWMAAMKTDRSFAGIDWDERVEVPVTTLDSLIERYGRPDFCKIDIEGYELEALLGLNEPLPMLSFEYIPAAMDTAVACVQRLETLGPYRYNWSIGENQALQQDAWQSAADMIAALRGSLSAGKSGDIHARLN
jgi:FkbM family methyltransferase